MFKSKNNEKFELFFWILMTLSLLVGTIALFRTGNSNNDTAIQSNYTTHYKSKNNHSSKNHSSKINNNVIQ